MRFHHLAVPTLLLACAARAQGELRDVLSTLAAAETLDSEAVGYSGIRSATWKAFLELRRLAGAERLRELTAHEDPVVRCYALRGLVLDHGAAGLLPILLAHADDTEQVAVMSGCIRYELPAGRVMVQEAVEHLGGEERLALAERHRALGSPLSGLVLLDTRARDTASLVRRAEAGDEDALVALAARKREADVARIDVALRRAGSLGEATASLQAATVHGSPELLSALRAMTPLVGEDLATDTCFSSRHWLAAMAVQQGKAAVGVVRRLAEDLAPESRARLWKSLAVVLEQHPSPALRELLPAGL